MGNGRAKFGCNKGRSGMTSWSHLGTMSALDGARISATCNCRDKYSIKLFLGRTDKVSQLARPCVRIHLIQHPTNDSAASSRYARCVRVKTQRNYKEIKLFRSELWRNANNSDELGRRVVAGLTGYSSRLPELSSGSTGSFVRIRHRGQR